jgi:hypothetical protein
MATFLKVLKWVGIGLAILFVGLFFVIGFGQKVGAPQWRAGDWFQNKTEAPAIEKPAVVETATEVSVAEKPAGEEASKDVSVFGNIPFTQEGEDGTAKFGYQQVFVVVITSDQVRHSCQTPQAVEEFVEMFDSADIFEALSEGDALYIDVATGLTSEELTELGSCFEIPEESITAVYRGAELQTLDKSEVAELEAMNPNTEFNQIWTVIRFDDGRESSVKGLLHFATGEYNGEKISVVRYNWHLDVLPAYAYPVKSSYAAD